jgi:phosphoribosyl-ATP pyrophosphohydrolase
MAEKDYSEKTTHAPGYHLTEIKKGTLGEISKILEEAEELADAEKQNCKVMALLELSDLIGAIEAYLHKRHPSLTIEDLHQMASITKRAFINGHRK